MKKAPKVPKRFTKPRQIEFWGGQYKVTPLLADEHLGDGRLLLWFEPLNTRPHYYLVRIDSSWRGKGNTDEMYATRTSGMGPNGAGSTSTGRSFIPAVSPNGKLARQISPGCIYGLAIRQSVKILPHVAQLVTPSLR